MLVSFDPFRDYSAAERKLFCALGYMDFLSVLAAPTLYRMAAEKLFLKDYSGMSSNAPLASIENAVRKGLMALNRTSCYRMTEEFDKLIAFDD